MERFGLILLALLFLCLCNGHVFANQNNLHEEISSLITDLTNPNFAVSLNAVNALAELGEPAIPYLRILYGNNQDNMVRNKVVQVLRKIGGEQVIPILLIALDDPDSFVRNVAVTALSEVGEPAVEAVRQNLIAANHYTSKTTIALLRELKLTDLEIIAYLLDELPNRRVSEQKHIARIIGEVGSAVQQVAPVLLELINDHSYDLSVRLAFLQMLGRLDPNLIPLETWLLALDSTSIKNFERLFWMAMDLFAASGESGVSVLRSALSHSDPEIRARASFLLGNMGELAKGVHPELLLALADDQWYVRYEAYQALKNLGYQVEESLINCPTKEKEHAPVEVRDYGGSVELTNGIITLLISKSNVRVTRLVAYGKNVLGLSGRMYFDVNGTGGYWNTSGDQFEVLKAEPEMVHVLFRKLATTGRPFEIENHFILRQGDSGFYSYVIFRHNLGVAATLEQTRHVLRIDPWLLPNMIIGDHKQGAMPSPLLFNGSENVADATDRLADGSVYSKYNWAEYEGEHHVHGFAGDTMGVWSISASNEYLNGGPTKQNLTVHYENVLLRMLHSAHYGSGKVELPANSGWEKIYGPYFTYINTGESIAELWIDAKRKAELEKAEWPYSWVDDPLYPLDRGQVSGVLNVVDGSPATGAWVVLAQPSPDWQVQGKDYLFWGRVTETGVFELANVRPGNYTLYAYGDGIVGELRVDNIQVNPLEHVDLGVIDWKPVSFGSTIWEIGTPNRSAKEFFIPREHYRHWGMWEDDLDHFDEQFQFIIGESDFAKDWLYAQYSSVPVTTTAGTGNRTLGSRDIIFHLPEQPTGEGVLTVLIAGSAGAGVNVVVNGTSIGYLSTANDASVYRSGIQGIFQEHYLKFDTSLLQEGENLLQLNVSGSRHGLMYDYLRLELVEEQ